MTPGEQRAYDAAGRDMNLSTAWGNDEAGAADEASLVAQVDNARSRGELAVAEEECRRAVGQFPDSTELMIAYGRVLLAKGHPDQAAGAFTRARELAPKDERPVAWQIAAFSHLRNHAVWTRASAEGLEAFPQSIIIRVALGRARLEEYQHEDALAVLSEADSLPGADDVTASWHVVALAAVHGCAKAGALAEARISQYGDEASRVRYRLGTVYLDHEWYSQAATCFEAVLASHPEHPGALTALPLACLGAGWPEKAELHARAAVSHMQDSPDARMVSACANVEAGDYEDGARKAQEALAQVPLDPDIVTLCIDVLRRAYRFDDAEDVARKALDAGITKAWRVRTALACVLVEKGKYDTAVEEAYDALAQVPLDPDIVTLCIGVLRRAYRFDDAEDVARKALDAGITKAWRVRTALAWVLSDMGRYESAISEVDQALRDERASLDDCNYWWAVRSRIDFLREARRFGEAEKAAEEALERNPDDPDLLIALAWVFSDQDQEQEAAMQAERALEKNEANATALVARIYFWRWARDWGEAKNAAMHAEEKRGKDPDVLTACGWLHSDLGDPKKALEFVSKALNADGLNSWALSCRIVFLAWADRHDEAMDATATALSRRPWDPRLHVTAGWLSGDLDHYDLALEHFGKALDLNPYEAEALEWRAAAQRARLNREEAVIQADQGASLRPFDPGMRVELGRAYDGQRRFVRALKELQPVLDREPDNVAARIARSAALRSQHLLDDAEQEINDALDRKRHNRDLLTELAWIYNDQGRYAEARQKFKFLLDEARNKRERAAAHYGIGWADLKEGNSSAAEDGFRKALEGKELDVGYQVGLAWAIARQHSKEPWDEAEKEARRAALRRRDPLAETCLGVIAFQRGRAAAAERQFKKALDLDRYGSRTDLAALYAWMARYDEAETELRRATERDPFDFDAHLEFGYLYLQPGYEDLRAAERSFRRALASRPDSTGAAAGLAQVLTRTGRATDAEAVLRKALQHGSRHEWRAHLALARLLIQLGSDRQNADQLSEACAHAATAIRQAEQDISYVSGQDMANLQFTAGLAQLCLASTFPATLPRYLGQRRALQYMEQCLRHDRDHVEALGFCAALKRSMAPARLSLLAVALTACLAFALLVLEWTAYLAYGKVSQTVVSVDTPIFAGLFTVSFLLPTLIRIKMPGFEAEVQPHNENVAPGPTGSDALGPGTFTVTPGPTGQIPRRGADSPHKFHHSR